MDTIKEKLSDEDEDVREASLQGCTELLDECASVYPVLMLANSSNIS